MPEAKLPFVHLGVLACYRVTFVLGHPKVGKTTWAQRIISLLGHGRLIQFSPDCANAELLDRCMGELESGGPDVPLWIELPALFRSFDHPVFHHPAVNVVLFRRSLDSYSYVYVFY